MQGNVTCREQTTRGVLLNATDFETMSLIELLNLLEGTIHYGKPRCEIHEMLVTRSVDLIVLDGFLSGVPLIACA